LSVPSLVHRECSFRPARNQGARIDYARRDLEYARAEDLAQIDAAGLILIIERLRTRLDDMLQLVSEVTNI
jgi:hypothetical protein